MGTVLDTSHQCRWCTQLTTGNGIYCSAKKKCLSESYTKRVNKCKDWEFCDLDAYDLHEYKPRIQHDKNVKGQMSLWG